MTDLAVTPVDTEYSPTFMTHTVCCRDPMEGDRGLCGSKLRPEAEVSIGLAECVVCLHMWKHTNICPLGHVCYGRGRPDDDTP